MSQNKHLHTAISQGKLRSILYTYIKSKNTQRLITVAHIDSILRGIIHHIKSKVAQILRQTNGNRVKTITTHDHFECFEKPRLILDLKNTSELPEDILIGSIQELNSRLDQELKKSPYSEIRIQGIGIIRKYPVHNNGYEIDLEPDLQNFPSTKRNAGVVCDMAIGPCSCGAWH